jgi:hypothetical protein
MDRTSKKGAVRDTLVALSACVSHVYFYYGMVSLDQSRVYFSPRIFRIFSNCRVIQDEHFTSECECCSDKGTVRRMNKADSALLNYGCTTRSHQTTCSST